MKTDKGLTNKKISNYLLWGGRHERPVAKGAYVAHPTRLDNLFLRSPQLSTIVHNKTSDRLQITLSFHRI
ncbi:MAG: hypothetical protein V7L21_21005 [Nostoc sp.]|uniref:hypothetical protein n=1 Tax=Nostoc sp. TaxID=1180 RepID=UPI002FF9CD34